MKKGKRESQASDILVQVGIPYLKDIVWANKYMAKTKSWIETFILPFYICYGEIIFSLFAKRSISFLSICFALLLGFVLEVFIIGLFEKHMKFLNETFMCVLGIYFIAEIMVYDSFKVYMPISTLLAGANGVVNNYSATLLQTIFGGFLKIVLLLGPVLLFIKFGKKHKKKRLFKVGMIKEMILIVILLWIIVTIAVSASGNRGKYKNNYDFDTATRTFGLMQSSILNEKYKIFGNKGANSFQEVAETKETEKEEATSETVKKEIVYKDNVMDLDFEKAASGDMAEEVENLNQYVESLTPSKQNEYTGLFKGKNLIMICAEAFSDAVISKELTPTLYRLSHNGIYFSDYYQPSWGGSTSSGEYSMLMGIAPLDRVETIHEVETHNNYFTMGNQLRRLGYYSEAFHDGTYDYYDRQVSHPPLGYDTYLGLGNGLEDITGWWPGDEIFLDKTLDTYIDNQPFSIYYMTVSGHFPYNKKDAAYVQKYQDRVRAVLGEDASQTLVNYYCSQMELEEGLADMVKKLEEKGIADDTVICLTADHYPYGLQDSATFGNSQNYLTELYGYEVSTPWNESRNAWILWSGCLENENKDMACEISAPTYSLDIVPTLSNLFGVEYDSRCLVGRDVFSDTEPIVLWANYSWVTEKGKYNSATDKFEPEGETEVDQAYIDRIQAIVNNKLKFSKGVVSTDYYGKLFDKTEQ